MIPRADVVVENFTPGTLERWDLAPSSMRALNPRVIVSRVSVYGQDGPYRDRPGLDRNGIALGGLLHITGYPDRPPVRPGVIVADYLTALFNTIGILAALVERARSGEGQQVELALYESVMRIMEWTFAANDRLGIVRERTGNRLANSAPLDNYETRDGTYVCIAAAGDVLFPRLARAIEREDLIDDPRFATLEARAANNDAINAQIQAWCGARDADEIERVLVASDVPVSRIYDAAQIAADEHVRARGSLVEVNDPVIGPVRQQAPVPRLDRTPAGIPGGAPRLGEHNQEIYGGLLGLSDAEMDELRDAGII
jgi:crotonobetainyl-CoA:carnitine CoA-transferase CaiB-like acyl-CoA transferase